MPASDPPSDPPSNPPHYDGPTISPRCFGSAPQGAVPPTLPANRTPGASRTGPSESNPAGEAPPTLSARKKPKPGHVVGPRGEEPLPAPAFEPGSQEDHILEAPAHYNLGSDSKSPLRPGHSVLEQQLYPGDEIGEFIEYQAQGQRRFGRRYVIRERRGSGAYGQVCLGSDRKVPRYGKPPYLQVAIKVIRLEAGPDDAEVKALATLSNPHVVKVLDHSTLDTPTELAGALCIIMEWVEGQSLCETLEKIQAPVSPAWLLQSIREIAAGTAAVHALRMAHRDLKLDNIQVDSTNGAMKLIDFGLACLMDRPTSISSGGTASFRDKIAGTPGYIPPDIWLYGFDEALPVTFRQDLFALAVIFYQMIVGANAHPLGLGDAYKLPSRVAAQSSPDRTSRAPVLSEKDKQKFAARVASCAYIPIPREAMPDDWLRQRLDELIQRALDMAWYKDVPPSKLKPFDSAEGLHRSIRALIEQYKKRRQHRAIWMWAGAVALGISVVSLVSGRMYLVDDRAQNRRDAACKQTHKTTQTLPSVKRLKEEVTELQERMNNGAATLREDLWNLAESMWFGGPDTPAMVGIDVSDVVAYSPTQKLILIRRGEQAELWKSGNEWNLVGKLQLSEKGESLPVNPSIAGALFVPDSPWLVTWHDREPYNKRVARWNSKTGQFDGWLMQGAAPGRAKSSTRPRPQLGEAIEQMIATPDGTRLFARTHDRHVWAWQENTGFSALSGVDFAVHSMALSPNGRTLALAGENGRVQLWLVSPKEVGVQAAGSCTLVRQGAYTLKSGGKPEIPDMLRHIAFDAEGKRVAIASTGWNTWILSVGSVTEEPVAGCGAVQLSECPRAAKERHPIGCPKVSALSFLREQDVILIGRNDGVITRWRLDDGEPMSQPLDAKHTAAIDDLAVLGSRLVISTGNDAVRGWDAVDQKPLWRRTKPLSAAASPSSGLRTRLYPRTVAQDGDAVLVRLSDGWLRLDGAEGTKGIANGAASPAPVPLPKKDTCNPMALLRRTYVEPTTRGASSAKGADTCQETQLDANAKACWNLACQRIYEEASEISACQQVLP